MYKFVCINNLLFHHKMDQIDPKNGYNTLTKTFHSLRPQVHLPPETTLFSVTDYVFSVLQPATNSLSTAITALIDSSTGHQLTYSQLTQQIKSLASYLYNVINLSTQDVAFILCSNSIKIPVLYFALLSLGVVVSPSNPINTESEISRQIDICKPVIAFATSSAAHKIPKLKYQTILVDSPEFDSMMSSSMHELDKVRVSQSDLAGILYSSGTTGKMKGVMVTHRNLIASVAGFFPDRESSTVVSLSPVPYFHVYGFCCCIASAAARETVVVMERFDLKKMLRAVEEFRITRIRVAPPVVVGIVKSKDITENYDLTSLERVASAGAPLGKEEIAAFRMKFPAVELWQVYGLTESTAGVFGARNPEESCRWGSVGRLSGNFEAKIVNPDTGEALPPGQQGELWVKGPTIMKGYIGDSESTSTCLLSDGWLRTGDLCYIDEEGFMFVVDRLKELIKYKAYQVAPAELEQLLHSHPEIIDAAVIPYPDEVAGEIPMAAVVKDPQSSLDERSIIDFVAKSVAPYKKIRRVAFVSSIPRNSAGKILRNDLKKKIVPN
ncbi:4-coumarate--CoA ligase-like 9 [Mercurialis annua]|uniref:4-coumarate--CoA ligase-like 9 n=1 Tax=Mercurialis annua TaxID=3986 RepID=UPI00215EF088|nr:4-coumarate--CoA ligase-like 9 [Mercurialis annua]